MSSSNDKNNMRLRQEISEITDFMGVEKHEEELNKLKEGPQYSHSIKRHKYAYPYCEYTCMVYVFGFAGHEGYRKIALLKKENVFAGITFAEYLIKSAYLKEIENPKSTRKMILYFNDKKLVHGGISIGKRVISKWGNQLHWRHGIWEVPVKYGDTVKYYELLSTNTAFKYFVKYAETFGVTPHKIIK